MNIRSVRHYDDDSDCCNKNGWMILSLLLAVAGIILLICGYLIYFAPIHNKSDNQYESVEYLINHIIEPYECQTMEPMDVEYNGTISCPYAIENLKNISELYCGNGYMCTVSHIQCQHEYHLYTDNINNFKTCLTRYPSRISGITGVTSYVSKELTIPGSYGSKYNMHYEVFYTGNPTFKFNTIYSPKYSGSKSSRRVYYYLQDIAYDCQTICDTQFNNRQYKIKNGICHNLNYTLGFRDANNIVITTQNLISACEVNDYICVTNYNETVYSNLNKQIYYDVTDPQNSFTYEKIQFGYKSAIAAFVMGGLFCLPICVYFFNFLKKMS
jgi:hypothetical protein